MSRFVVLLFVAAILWGTPAQAQNETAAVRGFITDQSDGQALQGVNVALDDGSGDLLGAISNDDGFFIITRVPPGIYELRASFIGYETVRQTLDLTDGGIFSRNFAMSPGSAELDEVVVESERDGGAARVNAGVQTVRPEDIELVPTPDVTGDLVSYLTTMPGVVSIGDRGGQLFIRGGEPSHNLSLLDGMYVYQPFHVLGFYSSFSSEILSSADVYAGGFGSKFSGRISSVIDVHTRNANKKSYRKMISMAPFMVTGLLEGPLKKDRISFLLSARASAVKQIASQYVNAPLPYDFGDIYGKVHAIITDNHQASFSVLRTYDRGLVEEDSPERPADEIRWQNAGWGLRYLILPKTLPVLAEILVSHSTLNTELGSRDEPRRTSYIGGLNAAVNITNYGRRSQFNWGFFIRSPEVRSELDGLYQNLEQTSARSTNVGGYLEPDVYVGRGLRIRFGGLAQLLGTSGFFIEPRLRLLWEWGIHQVSAAGGIYHQEIAGLNDRRDATNVFTTWTESPTGTVPQAAHALLGYRVTPSASLELSIEGYHKWLKNLSISEWTAFPRFTTNLQEASGRAMGLDLRMEIRRPNFYGFLNYGLNWVRYKAMQENLPIWFGTNEVEFRPPHDRRHQINLLARTSFRKIDFSLRWNFGSGLPYSQVRAFDGFILMDGVVDVEEEKGESRVIYDAPFGGELPPYHRLDISVERVFRYGEDSFITVHAGVINAYNRTNIFALDVFTLRQVDQLPFIPTIGVKFEF